MVCLGHEPRAAGWSAQMKPLSYGGTHFNMQSFKSNRIYAEANVYT